MQMATMAERVAALGRNLKLAEVVYDHLHVGDRCQIDFLHTRALLLRRCISNCGCIVNYFCVIGIGFSQVWHTSC